MSMDSLRVAMQAALTILEEDDAVGTLRDDAIEILRSALSSASPPPWLPIDTAPHKPGEAFGQPRVELWIPATTGPHGRPGFASHGHYDADTYSKKPRPYWTYDAANRTTDARARQPTHWRPESAGPQ